MATSPKSTHAAIELHNGDTMTREEFHRAYENMPDDFRAELIGGIVYVASPLRRRHGNFHMPLSTLLYLYEGNTPGVESGDNATLLFGDEGEPQPDLYLRLLPEYAGQTSTTSDDYIVGGPELITEIAHSSLAIDLHQKKDDYARFGVKEYLVVCLRERRIRWFDLQGGEEYRRDSSGVIRIKVFPGLWIHERALFSRNFDLITRTGAEGLASAEHAEFVKQLRAIKRKRQS